MEAKAVRVGTQARRPGDDMEISAQDSEGDRVFYEKTVTRTTGQPNQSDDTPLGRGSK